MAWRILLIVGAILALACGGTAIYAAGQPAGDPTCTANSALEPGDPGYQKTNPYDSQSDAAVNRVLNEGLGPCVAYSADAPLAILRSGSTTWWWFASAAIAVLTLASVPLLIKRQPA